MQKLTAVTFLRYRSFVFLSSRLQRDAFRIHGGKEKSRILLPGTMQGLRCAAKICRNVFRVLLTHDSRVNRIERSTRTMQSRSRNSTLEKRCPRPFDSGLFLLSFVPIAISPCTRTSAANIQDSTVNRNVIIKRSIVFLSVNRQVQRCTRCCINNPYDCP